MPVLSEGIKVIKFNKLSDVLNNLLLVLHKSATADQSSVKAAAW
jgi:hypothetical protein